MEARENWEMPIKFFNFDWKEFFAIVFDILVASAVSGVVTYFIWKKFQMENLRTTVDIFIVLTLFSWLAFLKIKFTLSDFFFERRMKKAGLWQLHKSLKKEVLSQCEHSNLSYDEVKSFYDEIKKERKNPTIAQRR